MKSPMMNRWMTWLIINHIPTYSGRIDDDRSEFYSFSSEYVNIQNRIDRIREIACDATKCEVYVSI